MKARFGHMERVARQEMWKVRFVLAGRPRENFINSAIKILMAVVIGALLLAGLYILFSKNALPTLSRRITEILNYTN